LTLREQGIILKKELQKKLAKRWYIVTITSSEREAIKSMMGYITEERARLMDQYSNLLDRLRELDKIDAEYNKQSVPVPTYFQPTYPNITTTFATSQAIDSSTISTNLEVAATKALDLSDIKTEDFLEFEDDIPESMIIEEQPIQQLESHMSLSDAIEKLNQQLDLEDENKDSWVYESEKETLREKDYNKRAVKVPTKKSNYRDVKVVASEVVAILKTVGRPIKTAELIKKMREADIDTSSPYALLNNVRKYEPRIQKIGFGFYQFKPVAAV
jgi:regulator of replication initiation timing